MAATQGHTAVTEHAESACPQPRVQPRIELPGTVSDLASEAVARLGWRGVALPEQRLLGRPVCLVARMRMDAHAERIAMGTGPVTDRMAVATWMWPELADTAPAPAAEVVGVLAVGRHWRTAIASAVPFARYGDAAMVLPSATTLSHDYLENCLPRARAYGIGVVTADPDAIVDLDLSGRDERMLLEPDALTRWLSEVAYQQLLACGEDVPVSVD